MRRSFYHRHAIQIRPLILVAMAAVLILIFARSIAQQPKWVAPKTADNLANPLSGNAGALPDAKKLYTSYCVPCHGDKGKGDGPAAPGLNPRPADHSSATVQSESDGALFWKLSEGHMPMPSYKNAFSEQQRWGLVNYIRTLAKAAGKK
ncbi:MAG: c-type cytochrome [Chitinophagales bacterium]